MRKFIIIIICLLIFLTGCSTSEPETAEIYIFGYEKADAVIITTANHTVMIDTGLAKMANSIGDYLVSNEITEIDYLIITHFDNDHIGSVDKVLEKTSVKQVIVPNYEKDSQLYNLLIQPMDKTVLTDTTEFTLDGVEFVLYPSTREYRNYGDENEDYDESDENNYSIAVTMKHGDNDFFFAGDAMKERIEELLKLDVIKNTTYDFLKVPHHGKYNKLSKDFISAVNPKYAVITCSEAADNKVVKALDKIGAEIFYTSEGNIYCKSDGETIEIEYKNGR